MKRKFVQIAALCLCAVLLTASGGGQTASAMSSDTSGKVIRVGLHYGTGAMEGLNLENSTGTGYRFGYYDGSDRFVPLGSTEQKKISVVKTVNVYYGTYNSYTSYHSALTTSNVAVGVYHLQLPGTYSSFADAQAAASRYPGGFAAYIGGTYYARVGNYTTESQARAGQAALGTDCEIGWTSVYGVNAVVTGTNTIVFQYDDQGKGTGLGVEPNAAAAGKYTTWSKGYKYYGGFRFERINGGSMTVVNMVEFEDYVEGVVATEMSDSWPVEALKAQAVAARGYAVTLGSKHSAHHFDICNGVDCQAYTGQSRTGSNTRTAVEQTAGQVCLYNGKVAQTFYYSSNGGASESSSNVWGSNQTAYPYLVGKVDPYEAASGVKNDYTKTVSSDTLVAALKKKGYNTVGSSIVSIAVVSLTDSGNPKQVTFTDNNGKKFTLDSMYVVRDIVGLRSYRYGFEPAGQQPSSPDAGVSVSVNGSAPVDVAGLYVIDGNKNVAPVAGDVYVMTGNGTVQLGQGGTGNSSASSGGGLGSLSSTTGDNGWFTFIGKGWGHNVGMSQYGAYAMAKQNYDYKQILQFYYTGVTVGFM